MPTILVADDNSNIQKMVSLVFEEKGIHVVAVGNGEAACRKVPEVHPDVVLADVFMPVRNGYEVCEFVKGEAEFSETPVILLVGAFDPLDEKEARRVNADGILKKPFVPPEPLIAMVTGLLEKLGKSVEEPPPPPPKETEVAAVQYSAPPPRPSPPVASPEPEESAEELAFGTGVRDMDEAAAPMFGQPVASPSAKNKAEEFEEEPATEWQRRRASMDYEISASQSASMVEDLAREIEEPKSPDVKPKSEPGISQENFSPLSIPEPAQPDNDSRGSASEPPGAQTDFGMASDRGSTLRGTESPAPNLEFPVASADRETEAVSEDQQPSEPVSYSGESATEEESPEEVKESEEETTASRGASQIGFSSYAAHGVVVPDQGPAEEAPPAESSFEETETTAASRSLGSSSASLSNEVRKAVEETFAEQTASSAAPSPHAPVDSATVDEVVNKVLHRLEPRIHDILSQGLLRPLVEELLQREADRK